MLGHQSVLRDYRKEDHEQWKAWKAWPTSEAHKYESAGAAVGIYYHAGDPKSSSSCLGFWRGVTFTSVPGVALTQMKETAENRMGEQVASAVITVPAHFSVKQRVLARYACEKEGLAVLGIINETSAAAVAYGLREKLPDSSRILALNLSGAALDVAVVEVSGSASPFMVEGTASAAAPAPVSKRTVEKCLANAETPAEKITRVVLTVPPAFVSSISTSLSSLFSKDIITSRPVQDTAYAAAVEAAVLSATALPDNLDPTLLIDDLIPPRSLGMDLGDGKMHVMLPRNRKEKFASNIFK